MIELTEMDSILQDSLHVGRYKMQKLCSVLKDVARKHLENSSDKDKNTSEYIAKSLFLIAYVLERDCARSCKKELKPSGYLSAISLAISAGLYSDAKILAAEAATLNFPEHVVNDIEVELKRIPEEFRMPFPSVGDMAEEIGYAYGDILEFKNEVGDGYLLDYGILETIKTDDHNYAHKHNYAPAIFSAVTGYEVIYDETIDIKSIRKVGDVKNGIECPICSKTALTFSYFVNEYKCGAFICGRCAMEYFRDSRLKITDVRNWEIM